MEGNNDVSVLCMVFTKICTMKKIFFIRQSWVNTTTGPRLPNSLNRDHYHWPQLVNSPFRETFIFFEHPVVKNNRNQLSTPTNTKFFFVFLINSYAILSINKFFLQRYFILTLSSHDIIFIVYEHPLTHSYIIAITDFFSVNPYLLSSEKAV